jgi:hypothetical protein
MFKINTNKEGERKMRKISTLLFFCGLLAFLGGSLFAPPAVAVLGDVDGDGNSWTLADLNYLIAYLFNDGPAPPNPIDADVDGFPGINAGDVLQLADYFVSGSCWPIPYTGIGIRGDSQIRFASGLISTTERDATVSSLKIIENQGPGLVAMIIPLSYANQPDQMDVSLDSVSFEGSMLSPTASFNAYIDNDNKTVFLSLIDQEGLIHPGTTGLVATFYFTKLAEGDPFSMFPVEIVPSHSFALITQACADGGSVQERILNPRYSLSKNGDLNCDGLMDLSDVLHLLNYLYRGGPPPCGW